MIQVNRPFLPPKEEVKTYIDKIWEKHWLTNLGPLSTQLEKEISAYLDVPHVQYVSNGTIALQLAIKALNLSGEIITSPFSYVASTSSIVWQGCKPIFADIDPDTFNIDPNKIEKLITSQTSGILATHVFGNPCDIKAIDAIAKKFDLKVIYDASHCFGTMYDSRSVLSFGDISTLSLHATKLFHSVEGGAVFTQDPVLDRKIYHMKNFGHAGPENFTGIGINGKNSEFHASMGLVNLKYVDDILRKRKSDYEYYFENLDGLPLTFQSLNSADKYNYAYFPIVCEYEKACKNVLSALNENEIFPRRYFYPSLNKLDYVDDISSPNAEEIASKILCLPLYYDLQENEIIHICKTIRSIL
ncbi:DegT/DnrJ/EryC1/StrS family aminotransferase [Reichenbachiella sp.]